MVQNLKKHDEYPHIIDLPQRTKIKVAESRLFCSPTKNRNQGSSTNLSSSSFVSNSKLKT